MTNQPQVKISANKAMISQLGEKLGKLGQLRFNDHGQESMRLKGLSAQIKAKAKAGI